MEEIKSILERIYEHYPRKIAFQAEEYKQFVGYQRLLNTRRKYKQDRSIEYDILEKLKQILPEYETVNWSDVESNNCMEYRILLHPHQLILDDDAELMAILKNIRYDLFLYVSILTDHFFMYINRTTYDPQTKEWNFLAVNEERSEWNMVQNTIRSLFSRFKFNEISKTLASTIVPDVETEFIEMGKANVFHCLFTDLETI